MKIEKENKDNSDIATTRILARKLDRISKASAITGLTLFTFVVINYFVPIFIFQTFPIHYLWYAMGFCFIVWFSTRKGGCGSCNQGGCI